MKHLTSPHLTSPHLTSPHLTSPHLTTLGQAKQSAMFARILYLFIVIPVFLTPDLLSGQSNSFCGYYRAVSPNGTDPDSLVYDRFGNVFDMEDLIPTLPVGIYPVAGCGTGYFNVTYAGGAPQEAQLVVCDVLSYVSSVIQQRQGQNSCGLQPFGSVEIQVGWISFSNPDTAVATQLGMSLSQFPLPAGWAAIGSPFYSTLASNDLNCNEIIPEQAFIKINGGKGQGTPTIFDGRILLNSDFTWNYDTEETNFTGADMKTAILHETMHVLGFASSMGVGLFGGAYTLWDQTLRTGTYDPVNGSSISQPAISSMTGCGRNCWETVSGFGALAINSCNGNGQDIVVGDGAIAPIQGDANVNPTPLTPAEIGAYINMLSHLSLNCNGQSESYVMRPVFGSGEYQRTLTLAEQQILCALGYSIPAIDCNGCYVVAQQDAQIEPGSECCFRAFHVCVGETFEILKDELLCNDLSGDNQVTITALWHQVNNINDPVISVVLNASGTGWDITVPANVKAFKSVSLFYTLSGCECRQHNGRVQLFIDHYCPATAFTEDPCDNLLRDGGFEDAKDNTSSSQPPYALGGWPMLFQGHVTVASPDIYKTSLGNHYLGLVNFGANQEAINLELQKCIKPGCELNLSLDLSSLIDNGVAIPALQVWGSETRPCPAITMNPVPLALNCDIPTECAPGDVFNPVCIFTNIQAQNTLINFDNPNFSSIENLTWLNETNEDVCFLTFVNPLSPGSGATIFLDNILAEIRCEPEVSCNAQPAETCEGQAAGLTFTVCATELPEYINFTTITPVLNLPSGWTLVGDAPQPFNLTEGQCVNVNLQVQMPAGTPAGAIANIVLNGTASGLCTELEWSCEAEVTVVDCPPLQCQCPGANDLNIDAGAGTSVFDTEIDNQAVIISPGLFPWKRLTVPCLSISGNLIISDLYKLEINADEIIMGPGAKITVNDFAQLRINHANQNGGMHGCDIMWRSIALEDWARLFLDDNIIQDAQYAVSATRDIDRWPSLSIKNTYFDRNHVGVVINDFNGIYYPLPQLGTFIQNHFDCSAPLLPSFDVIPNYNATAPFAGIELHNTAFNVGGIGNTTINNWFNGLRNGVVAERSDLKVFGANFKNITGGGPIGNYHPYHPLTFNQSEGIGIMTMDNLETRVQYSNFYNMYKGVNSIRSNTHLAPDAPNEVNNTLDEVAIGFDIVYPDNKVIDIRKNTIHFKEIGIRNSFCDAPISLTINQNQDIRLIPFTPTSNFTNNNRFGIYSFGTIGALLPEGSSISYNKIYLPGFANGIKIEGHGNMDVFTNEVNFLGLINQTHNFLFAGISSVNSNKNYLNGNKIITDNNTKHTCGLLSSASEAGIYCCNVTKTYSGFILSGWCDQSKIRITTLNNIRTGLECLNGTVIGPQDNAGNLWNTQYSFWGARHYGSDLEWQMSQIFIQNPEAAPLWPLQRSPLNDWVIPSLTGMAADNCEADAGCPDVPTPPMFGPGEGGIRESDIALAGEGFAGSDYGAMLQFEGTRSLYRRIQANSTALLGQNTLVDSLYYALQSSPLATLHDAESRIESMLPFSGALLANYNTLSTDIRLVSEEIDNRQVLLDLAADSTIINALLVEIDSLGTLLEGKVSDLRETINLAVAERQVQSNTALAELNQLTDVLNLLEQNRKTVDRIYLQTLARGIYTLTQNQRDSLWEIAIQCPAEGGNAVYEARSLYGLGLGTAAFDDEQLCSVEQRQTFFGRSATKGLEITLIPNPANDKVMLLLPRAWTGKLLQVRLVDVSGKLWLSSTQSTATNNLWISTSVLPAGIYYCHVSDETGQTAGQKLIIVR